MLSLRGSIRVDINHEFVLVGCNDKLVTTISILMVLIRVPSVDTQW